MRAEFAKPYGDSAALAVRAELLASSGVEQTVVGALELLPREEETVVCIYALDPANRVVSERQHGVVGQCVGGRCWPMSGIMRHGGMSTFLCRGTAVRTCSRRC